MDAIIPTTVNITPRLNSFVPGLNIQNADTHMKNKATANIYAKGLNHLFPEQFNWKEAGVDTNAIEPEILAAQMQQWKAF
jgi:hypothetical protein